MNSTVTFPINTRVCIIAGTHRGKSGIVGNGKPTTRNTGKIEVLVGCKNASIWCKPEWLQSEEKCCRDLHQLQNLQVSELSDASNPIAAEVQEVLEEIEGTTLVQPDVQVSPLLPRQWQVGDRVRTAALKYPPTPSQEVIVVKVPTSNNPEDPGYDYKVQFKDRNFWWYRPEWLFPLELAECLQDSVCSPGLADLTIQQGSLESKQPSLLRSNPSANDISKDTSQASLSTTTSAPLIQREENGKLCMEGFLALSQEQWSLPMRAIAPLKVFLLEIECLPIQADGSLLPQSCNGNQQPELLGDTGLQTFRQPTNIQYLLESNLGFGTTPVELTIGSLHLPSGSTLLSSPTVTGLGKFFRTNPLKMSIAPTFGGLLADIWQTDGGLKPITREGLSSVLQSTKQIACKNAFNEFSGVAESRTEQSSSFISPELDSTTSLSSLEKEQDTKHSLGGYSVSAQLKQRHCSTDTSQVMEVDSETKTDSLEDGKLQPSATHSLWVLLCLPKEQGELLQQFMNQQWSKQLLLRAELLNSKNNIRLSCQIGTVQHLWIATTGGSKFVAIHHHDWQQSSIYPLQMMSPTWLMESLFTIAKTCLVPTPLEEDLTAIAQDSGGKCSELSHTSDRNLLSSRMSPICVVEDLPKLSTGLPKAGMWGNGSVYALPILERPTLEKGCSLLPTPMSYSKGCSARRPGQSKLDRKLRLLPTPTTWGHGGRERKESRNGQKLRTTLNPHIREDEVLNPLVPLWMMGFPTGWMDSTTQVGGQQIQLLQSAESRVELTLGDTTSLNASAMPSFQELQRSPLEGSSTSTLSCENFPKPGKAWIDPHEIDLCAGTQSRDRTDWETVQRYSELMKENLWDWEREPRPVVFQDKDGCKYPGDCHHRTEAAIKAGVDLICVDLRLGSLIDAIMFSCVAKANREHGLPLTAKDQRRRIELFLETRSSLPETDERRRYSSREIGKYLSLSESGYRTIVNIINEREMLRAISQFTVGDRVQVVRNAAAGSGAYWPDGTLGKVQELDKKKGILIVPDTAPHLDKWMLSPVVGSKDWIHPDNLIKSDAPWIPVKISQNEESERYESLETDDGSVLPPQLLVREPKSRDKQLLPNVNRNGDVPLTAETPMSAALVNKAAIANGKPDVVAAEIAIGIRHLSPEQLAWVLTSSANNGLSDDHLKAVIKAGKQILNLRHHPEYFPTERKITQRGENMPSQCTLVPHIDFDELHCLDDEDLTLGVGDEGVFLDDGDEGVFSDDGSFWLEEAS